MKSRIMNVRQAASADRLLAGLILGLSLARFAASAPAASAPEPSAVLAQQESSPAEPGLRWVRFNSDHFNRPRDTGQAEQVNIDTGRVAGISGGSVAGLPLRGYNRQLRTHENLPTARSIRAYEQTRFAAQGAA